MLTTKGMLRRISSSRLRLLLQRSPSQSLSAGLPLFCLHSGSLLPLFWGSFASPRPPSLLSLLPPPCPPPPFGCLGFLLVFLLSRLPPLSNSLSALHCITPLPLSLSKHSLIHTHRCISSSIAAAMDMFTVKPLGAEESALARQEIRSIQATELLSPPPPPPSSSSSFFLLLPPPPPPSVFSPSLSLPGSCEIETICHTIPREHLILNPKPCHTIRERLITSYCPPPLVSPRPRPCPRALSPCDLPCLVPVCWSEVYTRWCAHL